MEGNGRTGERMRTHEHEARLLDFRFRLKHLFNNISKDAHSSVATYSETAFNLLDGRRVSDD